MLDLLHTFHTKTQFVNDERDVFNLVADFSKDLGFEYCSYVFRSMESPTRHRTKIFDSYPEGCMQHYLEHGCNKADPNIARATRDGGLIVWKEDTSSDNSIFWRAASEFGLNFGVSQSSWSPQRDFGFFSLSRTETPLSNAELDYLRPSMCFLTSYIHASMGRFLRGHEKEGISKLTVREREILLWTAEGKTSEEIGQILGISERTVNFHIYNSLDKTKSRNKTQAAIKFVLFEQQMPVLVKSGLA